MRSGPLERLALARLVSISGGGAAQLTLVYLLFERTGSAAWVTAALLATTGSQSVALPLLGALADRRNRRSVLVVSDLVAAVCWAALGLLTASPPVVLVLVAAVASVAEAAFAPASAAAIESIAGAVHLSRANGVVQTGANAGRLVGPAVGGLTYALVGATLLFWFNAVTFVVSAALVASIRGAFHRVGPRPARQPTDGALTAARFVLATPTVRLLLTSSTAAYVTTSFAMVAEPGLAADFGAGSAGYGLMIAGWGAGLVVGSIVSGRVLSAGSESRALVAGRLLMGTGMLCVPLSAWFAVVPFAFAVGGFGSGVLLVAAASQIQRHTPDRLRARVFAFLEMTGTAGFVAGVLTAALLVEVVGPRQAYLVAALGTLLSVVPLVVNLVKYGAAAHGAVGHDAT